MTTQYINYLGAAMPTSSPNTKLFWGNGVSSTLVGGGVDDTFNVWSQNDNIVETPGAMATDIASIYGSYQYVLPANVENLTISGTVSTVVGNTLSNLIIAQGSSNMTIDGDGGNDVVVGNAGADDFVVNQGYGHEVIYNFNSALDSIRLGDFGIDSFAALKPDLAQVGQDVVLTLDPNDSVTIRNTTVGQFSASNFQLGINPSSLSMTFDDEFNTFTSSPNGSQGWMTTFPYQGASARSLGSNDEAEYYSDSSVGVNPFSDNNGVLTITASPATPGAGTPAGSGLTYTSGLMTTYKSFSQLYGYFEVRAKLPTGSGFWPAFWLLPENNSWPPELDVFEMLGGDPSTVFETSHTDVGGFNTMTHFNTYLADASTTFNTYGVDWEKNTITWYINDVAVASMPTPADMNVPMYMLLNLAVGGTGSPAGAVDGTSSASMEIDYVRAYSSRAALAPVSMATFLSQEAALNNAPGGFAIADTAANILANISALQADANFISSITPTDQAVSVSIATYLADKAACDLVNGGLDILDTGSDITGELNALNDPNIAAIVVSTNHPIGLSVAELTADASTLAKLQNENGSPYQLAIIDNADNIEAGVAALAANSHIASIQVTSGSVAVSVAAFNSDSSALNRISGGFSISDSALNLIAGLAALQADSSHIGSISVVGAPLSVSVWQFGQYRSILDKIAGGFAIVDKASTISAAANALESDASHITSITATGTSAQAHVALSPAQARADAPVLAKISNAFILDVRKSDGSAVTTGHGNGLHIADSGPANTITGGGTSETFTFRRDFGRAEITDLSQYLSSPEHDVVSLPASEFANFSDLLHHASAAGHSTVLTGANGDALTLSGVTLAMLSGARRDFAFH